MVTNSMFRSVCSDRHQLSSSPAFSCRRSEHTDRNVESLTTGSFQNTITQEYSHGVTSCCYHGQCRYLLSLTHDRETLKKKCCLPKQNGLLCTQVCLPTFKDFKCVCQALVHDACQENCPQIGDFPTLGGSRHTG